jgi:hypothetical protein
MAQNYLLITETQFASNLRTCGSVWLSLTQMIAANS